MVEGACVTLFGSGDNLICGKTDLAESPSLAEPEVEEGREAVAGDGDWEDGEAADAMDDGPGERFAAGEGRWEPTTTGVRDEEEAGLRTRRDPGASPAGVGGRLPPKAGAAPPVLSDLRRMDEDELARRFATDAAALRPAALL